MILQIELSARSKDARFMPVCEKGTASFPIRQGLLVDKEPEGPPDGPHAGACGTPPDDAPSQDKLHLPCAVTLERDDPRAQGGGQKRTEKPASGKTPITGVQDMGGQVIRLPESADAVRRAGAPRYRPQRGSPCLCAPGTRHGRRCPPAASPLYPGMDLHPPVSGSRQAPSRRHGGRRAPSVPAG